MPVFTDMAPQGVSGTCLLECPGMQPGLERLAYLFGEADAMMFMRQDDLAFGSLLLYMLVCHSMPLCVKL